jgi:hypothetical protein
MIFNVAALGRSKVRRKVGTSGKKSRRSRRRSLRFEPLETKTLLSGVSVVANGPAAPEFDFEVVAKAQPDEWFNGIGEPYVPLGEQQAGDEGQPKVNQTYAWGMAQTKDAVWVGTGGNVATWGRPVNSGPVPPERSTWLVGEYELSQYPLVPEPLKPFFGDWRPPTIQRYDLKTGVVEDLTPDDPLINKTMGLRAAGANDHIVLLAGPNLTFTSMHVFAFDANTSEYLGSKRILRYSDIRRFVNVDGQLYTSALRTFSRTGAGDVLRWTGSTHDPFRFVPVGKLDLEGAYITEHDGRLFVATWPLRPASLMGALGFRSKTLPGIWMSPKLGRFGLTPLDAWKWTKVWQIDEYESDPALTKSYGMGALESFDGHLYWGTMQPPAAGPRALMEAYPDADFDLNQMFTLATRPTAIFRGKNFDDPHHREVELLYGDAMLLNFEPDRGFFPAPNNTGLPKFGPAGFGNGGNIYTWSSAVYENHLAIGTFDFRTVMSGDSYVALRGDLDAVEQFWERIGLPGVRMGGDLWAFPPDDGQPFAVTLEGAGNPLNSGFRNMESTHAGLFLGTNNISNLLTEPYNPPQNPLHAGGWELVKVLVGDDVNDQSSNDQEPNDTPNPSAQPVDAVLEQRDEEESDESDSWSEADWFVDWVYGQR